MELIDAKMPKEKRSLDKKIALAVGSAVLGLALFANILPLIEVLENPDVGASWAFLAGFAVLAGASIGAIIYGLKK